MPSEPITRLRGMVCRWVHRFHHKLDGYHGGRLYLILAPVPIPNGIVGGPRRRCGAPTQPARFRRMGFQAKRKMPTIGILSIPRWGRRRQATLPRFLCMTDPHNPSDSSAAPHGRYIPALDGLRGVAAMLVAGATTWRSRAARRCP
jgi:hypothetical protein